MGVDDNAIVGAFGSVIGYLGGEVAEPTIFERLLWPERFYNVLSINSIILGILLNPLGGPVHSAAMRTLDSFREKGLYGGQQQGHMLGTAFFKDLKAKYRLHDGTGSESENEVRNGLWIPVIQRLRKHQPRPTLNDLGNLDTEKGRKDAVIMQRTYQRVQHLRLRPVNQASANNNVSSSSIHTFCEDKLKPIAFIFVILSETTTLICAFLVGYLEHCYWFTGYLCIPLVLRLLALCVSVRREPSAEKQRPKDLETSDQHTILAEIFDYDYGFPLIEGPESLVKSFFRHWGHPIRETHQDRWRELAGIFLVFAFVFVFPAGLLTMLWTSPVVQIIWLSYQIYTIVVMHINRIGGLSDPGGIQDQLARYLAKDGAIRLRLGNGAIIEATLESHVVPRIADGRNRVREIVDDHLKRMQRLDGEGGGHFNDVSVTETKVA